MLTLKERAECLSGEVSEVAAMSMFNQPAAIKKMLPEIVGLISSMCEQVDNLKAVAQEQKAQIKRITGGV